MFTCTTQRQQTLPKFSCNLGWKEGLRAVEGGRKYTCGRRVRVGTVPLQKPSTITPWPACSLPWVKNYWSSPSLFLFTWWVRKRRTSWMTNCPKFTELQSGKAKCRAQFLKPKYKGEKRTLMSSHILKGITAGCGIWGLLFCSCWVMFLGHETQSFSYLPSFHFQSSLAIDIVDGPGLGVTEHCKLNTKHVHKAQNSPFSPDHNTTRQGHLFLFFSFQPQSSQRPLIPDVSFLLIVPQIQARTCLKVATTEKHRIFRVQATLRCEVPWPCISKGQLFLKST